MGPQKVRKKGVLWSGVPNGHVNLCFDLPVEVAETEMKPHMDARLYEYLVSDHTS